MLAAVCLHLGTTPAADAISLASAAEDTLLGLVRTLEIRVDSALSAAREALPGGPASEEEERQAGRDLINEVYEVVDQNFTDARGTGFDPDSWRRLRDAALRRPLRDRAAAYSAVREMLSTLRDPYSRFINPPEFAGMQKYDVSGVGLNLGTLEELRVKTGLGPPPPGSGEAPDASSSGSSCVGSKGGGTWVVGLIRGLAADRAGVRQGDQLLQADGAALAARSPFEVASLLQGPEEQAAAQQGSPRAAVQLTVRHLDGSTETVALQHAVSPATPSPVYSRLDRGEGGAAIGYVHLKSFDARAQRDVAAAVRRLAGEGAVRLTLDLRGNRGGLVSEGIEVARLFLDGDALVVRTEGKARSSSAPVTAPGPALSSAPLTVLVDGHTASASEIVAGALKDNCRAVLAGGKTYGKGLIQSVYELGDGSGLVLTVGKYLTPSGVDIDRQGIAPDFRAAPAPAAADEAMAACKLRGRRAGGGVARSCAETLL